MKHRPLRPWAASCLSATAVALACALALPAHASHVGDDAIVDAQAVAANDTLVKALRGWENAPEAVREARLQALVVRATERKERLARLIERNPVLAATRLLPASVIERLPAAARAQVEQNVQLQGTVFAEVASDVQRGFARTRFLMAAGGVRYELALGDARGSERDLLGWSGRRVTMAATALDRQLLVRGTGDVQVVAFDSSLSASASTTPTTTPLVTGDQKTLVILANFSDKLLSCTAADVSTRVFGSTGATVNTGFRESSRNAVSFSGAVAGPFAIPYTSSGACDYSGWGSAAESAAKSAGFDPAQYKRINIVTPSNSTCGWSGLAYMPGTRSWVQSCGATGVYTHELGHNLALHHASTPSAEYGDGSDPMGGARTVRNNGANQVMAGWVPTGGLLDVSGSGSFTIAAIGPEAGTQPQVLRLSKPDTNEKYYVSLRGAQGLDAALSSSYLNLVAVHKASGNLPSRTTLLASLAVGQSFSDSTNGITITNQGVASNTASVAISGSAPVCSRAAPTLALSPASQSAAPGAGASYTATLTNTNSAACAGASFALSALLPAGLSGSVSPASLTLASGASGNATLSVVSSATTAEGSYGLDVSAAESAGTGSVTAHASLNVVGASDNTPPTLSIASPADGATVIGNRVTIAANASDNVGIARVEFWIDGRLHATDTGAPYSANWNLRKAAKGAHSIELRAFDAAGNSTRTNATVTVQ